MDYAEIRAEEYRKARSEITDTKELSEARREAHCQAKQEAYSDIYSLIKRKFLN
jgi:hypothetical protein